MAQDLDFKLKHSKVIKKDFGKHNTINKTKIHNMDHQIAIRNYF
jgi:intein-encoded DNA endonuclease-like protein